MLTLTESPKTEILRNLPFADYVKLPGLNQSLIKRYAAEYEGCPAKYKWECDNPTVEEKAVFGFGRASHAYLLEPEAFEKNYRPMTLEDCEEVFAQWKADGAEAKSKAEYMKHGTYAAAMEAGAQGFATSKAYAEWTANEKREIISAGDSATIKAMTIALWKNDEVADEFKGATLHDCEVSLLAPHEFRDGRKFQLKARLDIVTAGDAIIDFKTCRSTNARRFASDSARFGYDLQAASNLIIANRCGFEKKRFGFLAQEKTPPFLNCIHWMPEEWINWARLLRFLPTVSAIAESIRLNKWPNPPTGMLEPPKFIQDEMTAIEKISG